MFPEAVAYAAVQAYHGLSSVEQWSVYDRHFRLDIFFRKCVKLFTTDPSEEWVAKTLSFLTGEMHALKRKPKRHLPEGMSDEDSDSEGGILAQRAARRETARLRAIDKANQTTNDCGGGTQPPPLSPPPSSPVTRPTDIDDSREESPLNDLTPSPRPHSDSGHIQSPSPHNPVNCAPRRPLVLRFSRTQNTSATATAPGHHQTQPSKNAGVPGGPSRRLPPARFTANRNISPTPSIRSPHHQTQPLESPSANRPTTPDEIQTDPKRKITVPAKKATKPRATKKRKY